jgi:hypothetical protein
MTLFSFGDDSALWIHGFLWRVKGGVMITELRAAFFLALSVVFFLIILGVLGLSTIMNPGRWSQRTRSES